MLFNSVQFFIFFFIFYFLWHFLKNKIQFRWILLTVASFVFYSWWSFKFLWLLIFTGLFDFLLALFIYRSENQFRRRFYLFISIFVNLSILISFKYAQFIIDATFGAMSQIFNKSFEIPHVPPFLSVLPIGISFYTFESLSYVIDVYSKKLTPAKNIFHYFSFLSMFPRLIAGPIERPHHLLPQLEKEISVDDETSFEGIKLITLGFFKKTVIADNLAYIVNTAFANISAYSSSYWWFVMTCFSIQIYCDFSGYTDIARGLAKLLGFDFNLNFKSPYTSHSFRDFWLRWHISLSTWFRDYVYIPLGGDRKGKMRTHINLWITMIISGFWHGASWNFGIWGALHAGYLSLERTTKWNLKIEKWPLGKTLVCFLVFILTLIAWVFFRAPSLHEALLVINKLLTDQKGKYGIHYDLLLFGAVAMHFVERYGWPGPLNKIFRSHIIQCLGLALLALAAIAFRGPTEQFIYFQF